MVSQRADQGDVRAKILGEAIRLFAHHGYGSTSMREVAEASGVTKPTLYYHFGSKEGLFRAIIEGRIEAFAAMVRATVTGDDPVVERLEQFLEAYLLGALEDIDTLRFMLTCSLPNPETPPNCRVIGRHLQNLEPLAELIREGIEAGELRSDLDVMGAVAALVGAANLHLATALEGAQVHRDTISTILNTWLHGAKR